MYRIAFISIPPNLIIIYSVFYSKLSAISYQLSAKGLWPRFANSYQLSGNQLSVIS
ncbi:hypothetical protein [Moorena sp. SIO2C4]|uniref:hypothetical protein n=1 Tax=Moorena sp. SIO2C4 TaxID=2607824 RepID=UPI0013C24F47|nr:hypothetical protein [Moorena sp. SIO2C4]NEQ13628.1 hypothetical protein [Moorena sp. SIO3E2]NES41524.1 hypothetical protein [Moorena sp. SIO2C4]